MASSSAPPLCSKDIAVDPVDQERNVYLGSNCDVVVSLVRRSTGISAPASTYQSYPTVDVGNTTTRLRMSNQGELCVENLGDVHMNSSRLRRCSKYFDVCLSERWAGAEIIPSTMPVHLTLDVHTDVQYYIDCFSRMYSGKYKRIPNVDHCLKLLQVASQINYLELVEDCVRYLTSVPWSPIEEEGIRQFANSVLCPSDCAADLSARLGIVLTNTESHSLLLNITESVLCQWYDDYIDNDKDLSGELLSKGFRLIIAGPCHTLVENVLQHIHDRVKKLILEAKEHPESVNWLPVTWTLDVLVETGSAKGLVEYIVEESPLCEILKKRDRLDLDIEWINSIFVLFRAVVEGHVLLNTSTRYRLIKDWTFLLLSGLNSYYRLRTWQTNELCKVLGTFVMTFPYEMQKQIISDWVAYDMYPSQFTKIQEDWFASLEKKMSSHEPVCKFGKEDEFT